jgi:YfiH family protein
VSFGEDEAGAYRLPVLTSPLLRSQGIVAGFTSRLGGVSRSPRASLNLGLSVGDDPAAVRINRRRVLDVIGTPARPMTIVYQQHGARVIRVERCDPPAGRPAEVTGALAAADGMVTSVTGPVLTVVTADCIPVLLADPVARVIGALHVGWQGLSRGVLESGLSCFSSAGGCAFRSIALAGPGVAACCYEVGPQVYAAVTRRYPEAAAVTRGGRTAISLVAGIKAALRAFGIEQIHLAAECTMDSPDLLYSHRRGDIGRQAGFVALLSE